MGPSMISSRVQWSFLTALISSSYTAVVNMPFPEPSKNKGGNTCLKYILNSYADWENEWALLCLCLQESPEYSTSGYQGVSASTE